MELEPVVVAGVFVTAFATDVLSTLYVRRSTEGKAVQAAVVSAAILVLGYLTLATAIKNWGYILPEASGAALGTYLTLRIDRRRENGGQ